MAVLKNDRLPAAVYNLLPKINNVTDVPRDHASDISDLKDLLEKHQLDDRVAVKLVHTHFDLEEGEVFVARNIAVPGYGDINIMHASGTPPNETSLYGHHYFVDSEGNLAAYEYMHAPGPDLEQHPTFISEFCKMVQDRGLQHKLGLSLRHAEDTYSTNELEYPDRRMCIDVPTHVQLPYNPYSFDTTTEFSRLMKARDTGDVSSPALNQLTKSHIHHRHCGHTDRSRPEAGVLSDNLTVLGGKHADNDPPEGLYVTNGPLQKIDLSGTDLDSSSGLFKIVSYISAHA